MDWINFSDTKPIPREKILIEDSNLVIWLGHFTISGNLFLDKFGFDYNPKALGKFIKFKYVNKKAEILI